MQGRICRGQSPTYTARHWGLEEFDPHCTKWLTPSWNPRTDGGDQLSNITWWCVKPPIVTNSTNIYIVFYVCFYRLWRIKMNIILWMHRKLHQTHTKNRKPVSPAALLQIIHCEQQSGFAVEKRKNVNQIVSGLILLNKPNTELSGFIKKKKQKKTNKKWYSYRQDAPGFERRSPAWLLTTLPIEPRKHSTGVVYCTHFTNFRTLQLYDINNVTWRAVHDVWFVKVPPGRQLPTHNFLTNLTC